MSSPSSLKRRLLIAGAVITLLLLGAGGLFAANTWGEVNRVTIDRPSEDFSSGPVAQPDEEPEDDPEPDAPEIVNDPGLRVFLMVGSDSRLDLEDTDGFGDFEGNRADVVMVLLKNGNRTALLSLPRDLIVHDPCRGNERKISELLEGCLTMNGATLLTVAVEDLIGESVDHFALVDLAGFQSAVDAIGGYEICVENPVRDRRARLELPAGCTMADGEQTLAWMRSRRTQELVDSGWRVMPGVNDLVRNERQRAFLIEIMGRISDFSSPQAMTQAAQAVAPFVTVDSDLTLIDAVNLAWTMRGLGSGSVSELELEVYDDTASNGAAVLRPTTPVEEIVSEFLTSTASDRGTVLGVAN